MLEFLLFNRSSAFLHHTRSDKIYAATQRSSQRSTFQPKDISLTLPNSCTVASVLLAYLLSMNLRERKDEFFFQELYLIQVTDWNKKMIHHHPQLLKVNRVKTPGSAGLTKAVEKGKDIAKDVQPHKTWSSHVTNIPFQQISSDTTWIMLSPPHTSFLETDSTIQTHWITAISFLPFTSIP